MRFRPVSIAALAAMLAMGTAACGSSGSSTNALAGLTAQQIATRALANTEAAPSVRMTGSGSNSGQPVTLDLTLVRGKGCEGTIGEGNLGSFRLVITDNTIWIMPDSKYWQYYQASGGSAAAVATLNGKYLKSDASDNAKNGYTALAGFCTVSNTVGKIAPDAGAKTVTPTTINGQPAVKIEVENTTKTGTDDAYVSDTAAPELLQLKKPGTGGAQLNFTYPATPVAITPPPPSQVIDGSQFGF